MIIHHQDNITAFAGAQTFYWPTQPLLFQRISIDAGAAPEPEVTARARRLLRLLGGYRR